MRITNLWKKILIAGASAGSAVVIAACYGAYHRPVGPPVRTVRGPVVHVDQRGHGPVSCNRPLRPESPQCRPAEPADPDTTQRIEHTR